MHSKQSCYVESSARQKHYLQSRFKYVVDLLVKRVQDCLLWLLATPLHVRDSFKNFYFIVCEILISLVNFDCKFFRCCGNKINCYMMHYIIVTSIALPQFRRHFIIMRAQFLPEPFVVLYLTSSFPAVTDDNLHVHHATASQVNMLAFDSKTRLYVIPFFP